MKIIILNLAIICLCYQSFGQKFPDTTFIHYAADSSYECNYDIVNFHKILKHNTFNSLELNSVLAESSTFIIAFKSDNRQEKELLNIYSGKELIRFTNMIVQKNKDTISMLSNPTHGSIVNYMFNFRNIKRHNGISFSSFAKSADSSDAVLEFYYFPRVLSEKEKGCYESSLSIKYGISLNKDACYYNSCGDTIWNPSENAGFNNYITGIGRDDHLNLNQKQSSNLEYSGLALGYNQISEFNESNNTTINNLDYLLWGTDNYSQTFENIGNLKIFRKQWKYKRTQAGLSSQIICIRAAKNHVFLDNEPDEIKDYWIAVYDSINSSCTEWNYYMKSDTLNRSVIFHIKNDTTVKYFSFLIAPRIFAIHNTKPICKGSNLQMLTGKVIGGEAPYTICLEGDIDVKQHSDDGMFVFNEVQPGNYRITIKDTTGMEFNELISITPDVRLLSDTTLVLSGTDDIDIIPIGNEQVEYDYLWKGPNGFVSTSQKIKTDLEGKYSLTLTDRDGCKSSYKFQVITEYLKDKILLYPNPVPASTPFTVEITPTIPSTIKVRIIDANGKELECFQKIDTGFLQFERMLRERGSYLLDIQIGLRNYTKKFIVL